MHEDHADQMEISQMHRFLYNTILIHYLLFNTYRR